MVDRIASLRDCRRLVGLAASVAMAVCGCERRPSVDACGAALRRYWASRDIDPFFSALPFDEAARQCHNQIGRELVECVVRRGPRLCDTSPLPIDPGWSSGLFCARGVDGGRGRCERSNRECEYYRHIEHRDHGRKFGTCEQVESAFVLVEGGKLHNPVPGRPQCERMLAEFREGGLVSRSAMCRSTTYEELVAGQPRTTIPPPL